MVWPLVVAAAAGAAAGGGAGAYGGYQQRKAAMGMRDDQDMLSGSYYDSLFGDPLLAQALSGTMDQKQIFNPQELFRDASKQIDSVFRRRSGEMLQQLAGYGIEAGGAQSQFMQQRLGRTKLRQYGDVETLINQAHMQAAAQQQMQGVGMGAASTLGLKQLQTSKL